MSSSMDCVMSSKDKETDPPKAPWWTGETVAVVTGANRGIGLALAARLAEQGLSVVLTARDEARGEAAAAAIRAAITCRPAAGAGLRRHQQGQCAAVRFRRLDVADPASVAAFASWVRDELGGIDILVNNAAVSFNEIDTNSVEHAETVLRTNFYGAKMLTEALLPLFRRGPTTSRVLNMSSQLGLLNMISALEKCPLSPVSTPRMNCPNSESPMPCEPNSNHPNPHEQEHVGMSVSA
ncbi:unnamed protein product [Urochloa decumbens]|uniref:Uncharacterized protein n=1 Tax=Urochloa decumbens TaxID=240449 RepID=A0ABC8VAE1_9POAL